MEKGILSKAAEKKIGGVYLDNLVKAGIFELFDGQAFTFAVRYLDNKFGDEVPDPYKTDIRNLIDKIVVDENYVGTIDEVCLYLDDVIDFPFIDDEGEKLIFDGLANILKGIFKIIEKNA
jgi:hypothetical protein